MSTVTIFTYVYLYTTASRHLRISKLSEDLNIIGPDWLTSAQPGKSIAQGIEYVNGGYFYDYISCIMFSALSVEAAVNHICSELIDGFVIIERSIKLEEKLKLLENKCKFTIDFGCEPFVHYRRLIRFRNTMAHGKTESLDDPSSSIDELSADWMKECTRENAEKIHTQTGAMISQLFQRALPEKVYPLGTLSSGVGHTKSLN